MQNFAYLPSRPLKEILGVLNFVPVFDLVLAKHAMTFFVVLIFAAAELFVKTAKFCTMLKFTAIQYTHPTVSIQFTLLTGELRVYFRLGCEGTSAKC